MWKMSDRPPWADDDYMPEEDYLPRNRPFKIEADARADAGDPDYVWRNRQATPRKVDFSSVPTFKPERIGIRQDWDLQHDKWGRPVTAEGKLLTPRQVRARARRKARKQYAYDQLSDADKRKKRNKKKMVDAIVSPQELEYYAGKPVDEWDNEELARGRVRDKNGGFGGKKPQWITREIHEAAMERFQHVIKTEMNFQGTKAIEALSYILDNYEVDNRGKPLISASTKADAAKFFLEHIVGKPKQRVETDISVKLQGILGAVMVNPGESNNDFNLAHMPGYTMQLGDPNVVDGEVVDDDDDLEGDGDG